MRHSCFGRMQLSVNAPIAQLVEQIPLKDKVVGSIPTGRTESMINAGVAKLVDARGLGPRGAIYGGSSPLPGTDMYPIK